MLCEYLMPILCQQGVTSWSRRRAPGSQTRPLLSKSNQQTDLISQKSFASLLHSIGLKVYPCICQKMYQSISIQWCFNIALSAWRQQLREHPFLLQQVQRGRGFNFSEGLIVRPAQRSELNPPQDLRYEVKHRLRVRSYHSTSAADHNCSCGWMRAYYCSKFFSGASLGGWRLLLPEVLNVGISSHIQVSFLGVHTLLLNRICSYS